ncbi:hypothetical protein DKX38_006265 [Salix brachista]|uniref:Uncharacterized protein n=1 Tax=Salix brachista TaxID=2182728 RepID=A0A5N5N2T4_9ROSI|nr:hypothetical protein DKX38_006265 [Salix brachista]
MQFCCFELSPELPTNKTHEAIELFYRIPKFRCVPSVYSLNNLISVLCRNSIGLKLVPGILLKSQVMNIRVEESTFQVLITALCRIRKKQTKPKLMLKVYVYKEGEKPIFHQSKMRGIYASEGWFMKLIEGNKKFVVRDLRKAHLFYLPFSPHMLRVAMFDRNSDNQN